MSNGRSGGGMWRGRGRDGENDPYGVAGGDDEGPVLRGDPAMPNPPSPDAKTGWRDTQLDRPVGPMPYAPNLGLDVAKVQRLLSGAGRYDPAGHDEQGGTYSDGLEAAIRTYQRARGLADDGTLMPNGPTVASLKRDLFGRGRNGKGEDARAGARDLRAVAARDDDGDTPRVTRVSDPGDDKRGTQKRSVRSNTNILLDGQGDDDMRDEGRNAQEPRGTDAARKNLNLLLDDAPRDKRGQNQLAQNDPEKRDDANPWGNAGDVRRKDNDELLRMGYGPGVWLPDRSDPTGDRILRFDLQTMKPMSDSRGQPIAVSKQQIQDDPDWLQFRREHFTWDEFNKLKLTGPEKFGLKQGLQKIFWPVPQGTERFWDDEGFGRFGAPRANDDGTPRPDGHRGYDIAAKPGADIVSPITGIVSIINVGQSGSKVRPGIAIQGTGKHAGMFVILEYADALPSLQVNATVSPGQKIGTLTHMLRFYSATAQMHMKNHLHVQVQIGSRWVDPRLLMTVAEPPEP